MGRITLVNSTSNTKLFSEPWKALKSLLFISILLWGRSQSKLNYHITFLVFLKYWRTMCVILLHKKRLKGELLKLIFSADKYGHSRQVRKLKMFGKEINANQQKVWNRPEVSNMSGTATAKAGLYLMETSTELAGNAKENVRKKNRKSWQTGILDICKIMRDFFWGKYIFLWLILDWKFQKSEKLTK